MRAALYVRPRRAAQVPDRPTSGDYRQPSETKGDRVRLAAFEQVLADRLRQSGQVRAVATFAEAGVGLAYGLAVDTADGGRVLLHMVRGSGPNDPPMTDEERAAVAANVARVADSGGPPRATANAAQNRAVEQLAAQVLAGAPDVAAADLLADGRRQAVLAVTFGDGSAVYCRTIER